MRYCLLCKTRRAPVFHFPTKNECRLQKWLDFCNIEKENIKHYGLCHVHFENRMYMVGFARTYLTPSAVPTLHPQGLNGKHDFVPPPPVPRSAVLSVEMEAILKGSYTKVDALWSSRSKEHDKQLSAVATLPDPSSSAFIPPLLPLLSPKKELDCDVPSCSTIASDKDASSLSAEETLSGLFSSTLVSPLLPLLSPKKELDCDVSSCLTISTTSSALPPDKDAYTLSGSSSSTLVNPLLPSSPKLDSNVSHSSSSSDVFQHNKRLPIVVVPPGSFIVTSTATSSSAGIQIDKKLPIAVTAPEPTCSAFSLPSTSTGSSAESTSAKTLDDQKTWHLVQIEADRKMKVLKEKIRSLQKALNRAKARNKVLTMRLKLEKDMMTNSRFKNAMETMDPRGKDIITAYLREGDKKKQGRRYTLGEKITFLSFLKEMPNDYHILSRIFQLPSRKTLVKLLRIVNIPPEISDPVKLYLENIARKFNTLEKKCIFTFDEIAISPGVHHNKFNVTPTEQQDLSNGHEVNMADRVLVVIVKGLYYDVHWRYPLAYYCSNGSTPADEIVRIIKDVVSTLEGIGFDVFGFVCNQGIHNVSAIHELMEASRIHCAQKGVFYEEDTIVLNQKVILPIYDAPLLLKGLANNLLKRDIIFTAGNVERLASWSPLITAYTQDVRRKYRCLPKLTDKHVLPKKIKEMNVKRAAQIFSHTNAAHLGLLDEFRAGFPHLMDTSILFKFVDGIFDSLNSQSVSSPVRYKPERAAVSARHDLTERWIEAVDVFESMYCVETNGCYVKTPTIRHWVVTLKNVIRLWKLMESSGMEYFFTRRVHQDADELFFPTKRRYCTRNSKLTASQFISAFKNQLLIDMTEAEESLRKQGDVRLLLNTSFVESMNSLEDKEGNA